MQIIQPLATREGPRQALMRLVTEQPLEVWVDSRRLAALLRDYCPAAKREILAIQLAQQERLVEDLQGLHEQLPVQALITRLSRQLQERAGLTESLSNWSLTSWACALGYLADDGLDPSNSETVVNAGSQTFSSSPAIITPTDPYRDLLISACELLNQATSNPKLEEAVAAGEQALRLVSESLKFAPSHAGLQALAVQTRAETARLSQLLAQSVLAAGSTTRATELWQRVLELAPQHREARAGLLALQEKYAQGFQEAEELWKSGKLPAAIAQLERLQKRFPHLEELGRLLADRRSALAEIQAIRNEIPALKQSGRLQRLQAVYDRLETLAPVPGLLESRQVLVNQLAQAEPTLAAARTALQAAQYDEAIRHAGFVLTRFVDHAEAQELRSQAETAQADLLAKIQLLQTSIRTGDVVMAEESYAKFSAAEQQLPALLMPNASLRGLRARQSQRRQQQIAVGFGLILWLLAGWIAQLTTPSWSALLGQLPTTWPVQGSANGMAQVVQSLIAAFLLGTSAAMLRGKGEFHSILWLLAATTVQLIVGIGWLYAVSTIPALDHRAWHVLMRGVLYGFWIVIAYGVLLGQSKRPWFSAGWGCLVGSCLILGCLSLPETMQSDARQMLLAASLWMTALLALGWIDRLTQFVLVPFALILLALIVPSLSDPAWEPARWMMTGSLFTLALLPLAANRLLRWQIAVILFMAILATAGASQLSLLNSPPDLFALAMLWCWTWLPCLRTT